MATVLDMAYAGVEDFGFASFDEKPLKALTADDSSRNACLPSSCETTHRALEHAGRATLTAALRRELREARKNITVSACIALATAVAAVCFGLLCHGARKTGHTGALENRPLKRGIRAEFSTHYTSLQNLSESTAFL
ncbi:MAG: hypothetical protein KDB03_23415 [Planctomycetales bacterium]|nr:hypothetical protein [Planctomycetales bacterium]